jgi:hypothetical protein
MKTWIVVKVDDLSVIGSYDADHADTGDIYGPRLWWKPPGHLHIELPAGLDRECLKYEDEELILDPIKVNIKMAKIREWKFNNIRTNRDIKLAKVDTMVNEVVLGKRSDSAKISAYRDKLLAATDNYKNEDGSPSSACDDVALDLSNFKWPVL